MLKKIGFPPKLDSLLAAEDRNIPLWLVGGAIRDHFTGRSSRDFDFVTSGDALALARTVADKLNADVYILDRERGAGRVLSTSADDQRQTYDFSQMRGDTIEADLMARDFTINALAIRISEPDVVVDPCGGLQQLHDGILDLCTADAIKQDPIRALRATRIAAEFGLQLSPALISVLREKVSLDAISRERIRDELFQIFALNDPAPALRLMLEFGYFSEIFEPSKYHKAHLPLPSIDSDSMQVAIRTVQHLNSIFMLLSNDVNLDRAAQATLGLLTWTLGRYRPEIQAYLREELNQGRNLRSLTLFVTFLCRMLSPIREPRLPDDPLQLAILEQREIIHRIGEDLRLSRRELVSFDRWMDGLKLLDQPAEDFPEMNLYSHRFFRQTADSGLGAILSMLSLELSSQIEPPAAERWASKIELARSLFEAWFDQYEVVVDPEHFISGRDVLEVLGIDSGPDVGRVIESVREAQVQGDITTRDQAIEFIKRHFEL